MRTLSFAVVSGVAVIEEPLAHCEESLRPIEQRGPRFATSFLRIEDRAKRIEEPLKDLKEATRHLDGSSRRLERRSKRLASTSKAFEALLQFTELLQRQ